MGAARNKNDLLLDDKGNRMSVRKLQIPIMYKLTLIDTDGTNCTGLKTHMLSGENESPRRCTTCTTCKKILKIGGPEKKCSALRARKDYTREDPTPSSSRSTPRFFERSAAKIARRLRSWCKSTHKGKPLPRSSAARLDDLKPAWLD